MISGVFKGNAATCRSLRSSLLAHGTRRSWAVLCLMWVALALSSCTAIDEPRTYSLGDLMEAKDKTKAPRSIVAQVVAMEDYGLKDDKRQHLWSDESSLLSAVPVNLNDDGVPDYLVYPSAYLPTFCGAHSIACWVFKGNRDGTYDLVLAGRHDEVRIHEHKTNGFRDIDLVYGAATEEIYSHQYDGRRYVRQDRPASR
jgi:hypothetical protein